MTNTVRNNYFTGVRLGFLFAFSALSIISSSEAGVSLPILLLGLFFISCMLVKELVPGLWKIPAYIVGVILIGLLIYFGDRGFLLLAFYLAFEVLAEIKASVKWYAVIVLAAFAPNPYGTGMQVMVVTLLAVCYIQHYHIVLGYKEQMLKDTIIEQDLKKDIYLKDAESKAEIRKNMLLAENKLLEGRSRLAQTLHDKLGHNINGSIYQLEAIKVILDKNPDKSKAMLQGVIDQMRGGMDEIRAILRKERPEKKEQSMLQLYKLCEDCNEKGVEMELNTSGDMSLISEANWEIILDNAFEAVTNSMKYSKCTRILLSIIVMNKMVRCSIADNGIGCRQLKDGMGISGMRSRVRGAGGTLSFETENGFTVNMLLPM